MFTLIFFSLDIHSDLYYINPDQNIWLRETTNTVVILAVQGLKLWFYLSFISKICSWAHHSFEIIPQNTSNQ